MQPQERQPDMTPPIHTERDKRHRFPGAIINHGAWRYDGVHLRDRDAQALSCERGIDVTSEAIHPWCQQFGRDDANSGVAGDAAQGTHDRWHVDELVLTIHGERHDLWPAIGSGRPCPGDPGATSAPYEGRETVLSQVAQGLEGCATRHHDGSAQTRRWRYTRGMARGGTPAKSRPQSSG
jgi:hypothetical protein